MSSGMLVVSPTAFEFCELVSFCNSNEFACYNFIPKLSIFGASLLKDRGLL